MSNDCSNVATADPSGAPSCTFSDPIELFNSNSTCCCEAFYYHSNDEIVTARNATFICLVCFYGLAILYSLYDLRGTYDTKNKSKVRFLKSRKFAASLVSFFSLTAGIICVWMHYSAFMCLGGRNGCTEGGPTEWAIYQLSMWYPLDSLANIGFIASKIMVLRKCLRNVQFGLSKSSDAPNDRMLSFVIAVLCALGLSSFAYSCAVYVNVSKLSEIIGKLQTNETSTEENTLNYATVTGYFGCAVATFVVATLSSLLYIWHTTFHLNRYLRTLQVDPRKLQLFHETESIDSAGNSVFSRIKRFAMKSPVQKTVKNLNGNLRRLQLSVALIALSFIFRALLYVLLAFWFVSTSTISVSKVSVTIKYAFCVAPYSTGRAIFGSPLVIPLVTLFCDPLMMMYAAHSHV
jgi:ABC-type multidrug transport system fused ATPase/permease subunit